LSGIMLDDATEGVFFNEKKSKVTEDVLEKER
jgi:hypothetical protein